MDERWAVEGVSRDDKPVVAASPVASKPAHRIPLGNLLGFVVGLVGVGALAATAWVYAETQRDIARLSTDIAEIKLSLELFSRQQPSGAVTMGGVDNLLDLSNRLAILEQSWRGATPPTSGAVSLPATPATSAPANGATDDDCLPTGTRFMVAAGDSYPVCGTGAVVEIGSVDDGFIALSDGTIIAQGGNILLPGSACMIGVVPSDGGSISGFAEIRVTC